MTTHIVFAGGGTGGHLFPGLAVADRLAAAVPKLRVTFCGGGKPFERERVARAGFEYFAMPTRPLPRGAREAVSFVIENLAGYLAAVRFLREERPAAVVGLGGYASVPMARAAAARGIPLVLLEQNAVPGKATRWLARRASLVCTAFEQTAERLRCECPVRVTGNPVRRFEERAAGEQKPEGGGRKAELFAGMPNFEILKTENTPLFSSRSAFLTSVTTIECSPSALRPPPLAFRLLVLGGSGGARALNENVPLALYKNRSQLAGWQIVHQSGQAEFDAVRTLYSKLDMPAAVVPFVEEMPQTLAATDLAICRAGGTTLAELSAAGVPAVLLPYPHATDDHQAANARHYAAGGGCITIDQRNLTGRLDDEMAEKICFLLANKGLREQMAAEMRKMARPNAAADVAELIWSIVSSRSRQEELSGVA